MRICTKQTSDLRVYSGFLKSSNLQLLVYCIVLQLQYNDINNNLLTSYIYMQISIYFHLAKTKETWGSLNHKLHDKIWQNKWQKLRAVI